MASFEFDLVKLPVFDLLGFMIGLLFCKRPNPMILYVAILQYNTKALAKVTSN